MLDSLRGPFLVLRFRKLLHVTRGLKLGLKSALELLPFLFCFDLALMLSIASDHELLGLLNILHVQIMKDRLVPSKLEFNLALVMILYPLKERLII